MSGLTQPSTASESNTTITEKSSFREERRRKDKSSKGGKVRRKKQPETPSVADTQATQSDVFQFLSEDASGHGSQMDAQSVLQASSPSVASSADSLANDSKSSDASGGAHDTPRTSPTSTRRSHSHGAPYYGHYQQQSGKPLYASSFVHGPGDEEAEDSEAYSDEESTYSAGRTQHSSQSVPNWKYLIHTLSPLMHLRPILDNSSSSSVVTCSRVLSRITTFLMPVSYPLTCTPLYLSMIHECIRAHRHRTSVQQQAKLQHGLPWPLTHHLWQ